MSHYLEQAGHLGDMPGPAINLALFLGSIVGWVTSRRSARFERTNVPCRRSPGRKRCRGEILAGYDEDPMAISWHCPVCGDNGVIRGWQGTRWDRRRG